ncbi:hypothetical protein EKO27_g9944 [Xylaria grammica]|uniref:Protein kinase domain-containing protein n=1 Tax=Xylaria grammica TaxID=363999 RepID=A0A439CSM9_9PEZI|nr:hypothetical protein EKO27_g9944 [Xylaria grammica]
MEPLASDGNLDHFMRAYHDPRPEVNHNVLNEPTLLRCFSTLPSAVSYIHSKGMMHRDIKPSNCLVHDGKAWGLPILRRSRGFHPPLRSPGGERHAWSTRRTGWQVGRLLPRLRLGRGGGNSSLGDRCKVNPWFRFGTDRHGNRLENIRVSGRTKAIGSYSDDREVISNGLHIDPTSNYYAEV